MRPGCGQPFSVSCGQLVSEHASYRSTTKYDDVFSAMSFDTELFINEIKKRPAIWDLTSEEYSNRIIKQRCWEEMVELFGGENKTLEEKKKIGEDIQKKWRNIKDCFNREKRRLSTRSGSAATRKSEYRYFKQLSFLAVCSIPTQTHSNIEATDNTTEEDQTDYRRELYNRKKKKRSDGDELLVQILREEAEKRRKHENEVLADEDKLFFLSLSKEFKKVPDHLKLSTKKKILDIIYEASIENQQQSYFTHDFERHIHQYSISTEASTSRREDSGSGVGNITNYSSSETLSPRPLSAFSDNDSPESLLDLFNDDQ